MRNSRSVPRRLVRRGLPPLLVLLAVVTLAALQPRCGGQYALLLTLSAKQIVKTVDVKVKDLATHEIVLQRTGESVDPSNLNRDISKPGQELKLAIEFAGGGHYLIYILGRSGGGARDRQYALKDYQIDGVREESLVLVPLPEDQDADNDSFPACPKADCAGQDTLSVICRFLDCNDSDPAINPFAQEICGNGVDEDCSAGCGASPAAGDEPCVDKDGDGVPKGQDCDDNDPCRSPKILEAANFCDTPQGSPLWQLPPACGKDMPPPRCGDGIDQDCSGSDVACIVDDDCDKFPAGVDCDDHDPKINPAAPELCDGKDNNCNGIIDEGCVPCDVDGDEHAAPGTTDPACKGKPQDDTDDFDAGINPDTTKGSNGQEGGTALGALREYCSYDTKKDKNGLRPRDVDHDGDGKAAKDDGCASESCDKDGDGFAGPQCNPPKALEDCDDNDPKIFPGAPDRCGDGIAQNCVSDAPCDCDKDGDGYCPPFDCDDNDPNVHPWATEICDDRDNDCDGLVNEGNPDRKGQLISTTARNCNNDNDGMCACPPGTPPPCGTAQKALSGTCGCTKSKPTPDGRDPGGNRVACPGEDWNAPASPRCFLATAPQAERCLAGDFNCDGHDTAPGEPFDLKGKACGTDTGNCKQGKIVDCNLGTTSPYLSLAQAVDKTFVDYPHIVCSGQLPFPEVCNGKNDACTANAPPSGAPYFEGDVDGDGYLACSGCTTTDSDPRKNLAQTLKGCGDCNDLNPSIHPGAVELCNGFDDNCVAGIADDGQDECSGPTGYPQRCCTGAGCKNVATDVNYCGGCNTPCNTNVSDSCVGGQCSCGNKGSTCASGQSCQAGSCVCRVNGECPGCCSGSTCVFSQSTGQCGAAGAAWKSCDDGNPCTADSCNSGTGQCVQSPFGPTTSCNSGGGKCRAGNCCSGCWDGSTCQPGNSTLLCGATGDQCGSCSAPDCKNPTCNGGTCGTSNKADGSACSGGKCKGGSCCKGCWAPGPSCVGGTATAACGGNGDDCVACTTAKECYQPSCNNGSCGSVIDDTASCPGGQCLDGSCCTQCITGTSSCASDGTSNTTCGLGGVSCVNCTTTSKSCNSSGNCVCSSGCTSGSNCWAGTGSSNNTHCGTSGACTNCTTTSRSCNSSGNCVCSASRCWDAGNSFCYLGTGSSNNAHCGVSGDCIDCTTTGQSCNNSGKCT